MKNWVLLLLVSVGLAGAQDAAPGNSKAVGTVQAVSGNGFTLKSDAGAEVSVTVSDATRMLRSEPGQKSLKDAAPAQFSDVQAGDRALASGKASTDGKAIAATTVVLMKKAAIASKQEEERQDWQRRGVGGLVSAVDASTGTITISTMAMGQKKDVAVHTSSSTIVRRYAPDSVKFDDAKKSTVTEIKPGDQLRARGEKNADGTAITAEEIVSGSFRNVAGTVESVDKGKNQVTVKDLATKKSVTVAIGGDSQMRKLPEMMAQRIAARLKGTPMPGGPTGQAGAGGSPGPSRVPTGATGPPERSDRFTGVQGGPAGGPGGNGMRGNGGGDMLQQVLNRAPVVQLTDLQKGDAVMVVATEGSASTAPTVITLLSGVEPILSASPKGGDTSTILSPWNLGGGGGGGGDVAQ